MKLRELFEARQRSVGIIFGRFNPPHKGHRAAWEMASENDAWFVGTNQSTQGPKDPLPYDVKIEAMKAIYPEIQGHIMPEQSWLTMASAVYKKYGNVVLNLYTDEEWVSKAINQYNGQEGPHGLYNFKVINTQPTPRLSSATALRAAVQAGDREAFADAAGVDADTPVAGQAFFDLVAQYLNPYAAKEKAKVAKKKAKEPVAENNSLGTMPTTEYVKGIYAAAAENGMGAPDVEAVKKQMVIAPNGEVDIMKTMQKAVQVFQSSEWKQMLADLDALIKKAEAQQGMAAGLNELSSDTVKSYKAKAQAQVKELEPHAKKGEYKDLAQRVIDRRERGIKRAEKRVGEEAAGVGIITKQNTTVDVNKGTPRKNLKAFKLI